MAVRPGARCITTAGRPRTGAQRPSAPDHGVTVWSLAFAGEKTVPRLIDLSHAVEDGMQTYPGLPAPVVREFWTREDSAAKYAQGTSFHIGRIEMAGNTGTYVDAPFHRYAGGKDLADLPLESLADLEGVTVEAPGVRALGPDIFPERALRGKAVLVHTGWARHWGTGQYFAGHPFLTRAAAELLRDAEAALVGIDSLNIDDTDDPRRPVHSILLEAEIPVVEHLCRLELLPRSGYRFHAVPVKVRGLGSFPVRAYAALEK